jgi:hypothetical protein
VTPMRRLLLALLLLAVLVVPAAAMASGRDVLRDCADDEVLSKTYTQREYREALSQLATDSSEYSDCESVIRRAQLEQAAGRGGGGSGGSGSSGGAGGTTGGPTSSGGGGTGGGGAPPAPARSSDPLAALNPEERLALAEARTGGGTGIRDARLSVAPPGASRAPGVSNATELPGPIAGLLILLAGALVVVTGARIRTRVLGRRAA